MVMTPSTILGGVAVAAGALAVSVASEDARPVPVDPAEPDESVEPVAHEARRAVAAMAMPTAVAARRSTG
jgi:hypothetical protein